MTKIRKKDSSPTSWSASLRDVRHRIFSKSHPLSRKHFQLLSARHLFKTRPKRSVTDFGDKVTSDKVTNGVLKMYKIHL